MQVIFILFLLVIKATLTEKIEEISNLLENTETDTCGG